MGKERVMGRRDKRQSGRDNGRDSVGVPGKGVRYYRGQAGSTAQAVCVCCSNQYYYYSIPLVYCNGPPPCARKGRGKKKALRDRLVLSIIIIVAARKKRSLTSCL